MNGQLPAVPISLVIAFNRSSAGNGASGMYTAPPSIHLYTGRRKRTRARAANQISQVERANVIFSRGKVSRGHANMALMQCVELALYNPPHAALTKAELVATSRRMLAPEVHCNLHGRKLVLLQHLVPLARVHQDEVPLCPKLRATPPKQQGGPCRSL